MFPTPHEPGKDVFIFNGKKSLSNYAFPYPPFDKAQLAKEWPDVKYSMAERDDLVNVRGMCSRVMLRGLLLLLLQLR